MKKSLLVLFTAALLSVLFCCFYTAGAANIVDSGTCGENLTWTLDSNGTLTISGTGDMTDWSPSSNVPWYSKLSSIKKVVIENGVTSIGNYAFESCYITSVEIPDNITSIGDWAFSACNSLASITVDSNNQHYSNDEYGVLFDKNKTTLIQYPAGNAMQTYTIPDSVTSIGDCAFSSCNSLASVVIPDSVTSIGSYAFKYCDSLTSIVIPDSVTSIGDYTFYNCASLTSIVIPDIVTSIGNSAFKYCDSLTIYGYAGSYVQDYAQEKSIPFVVIGGKCGENAKWTLLDGILTISGDGDMTDYARAEDTPWYNSRESITKIVIKNGITSISAEAFADCDGITEIKIPDSVVKMGKEAFSCCDSLEKVVIGRGLTQLADDVFGNCINLEEITIPKNVTSISALAFRHVFNFVINAPADSYAQTYATENGYTFNEIPDGIPGDVTADGTLNRQDLLRLAKHFAGWDVEIDETASDVTGDGTVNRQDLLRLAKHFAGWDVTLGA